MHSPLLNTFIFVCKLMTCISVLISMNTHHWIRLADGKGHEGPVLTCRDYGHFCYESSAIKRALWFFYIITLINVLFELLNILLLCSRTRSRINLILEEIDIVITLVFLLLGALICAAVFIISSSGFRDEKIDWSFIVFLFAVVIALIDFICSLVRVVSYCRDNSFRSNVITYTSNNHGAVAIQA